MISRHLLIKIAPWALLVLLGVLWQVIVVGLDVPTYLFPSLSDVFRSLVADWRPIAAHSLQTLYTTLAGFVLAVVVGLVLGVAVGASALVYKAVYPLLVGFNSIPKVAFVPVLVVWFGIGTIPAIATAFLISFFPVVVNVATGLATVEPEMEDVLRSLGASRLDILKKVGLPPITALLLCLVKSGDHAGVCRIGDFGNLGLQPGHWLSDDVGELQHEYGVGVCGVDRYRRNGGGDV